MERGEYALQLREMVAADSEPTLDNAAIEDLLASARLVDANGRKPTDDNWTPTYDLDRAAAAGWARKMGKLSATFDFTSEDRSKFMRSQAFAQCREMVAFYRRRIMGAMSVPGTAQEAATNPTFDPVVGN